MANPALVHMLGYTSFEELSGRDLEKEGYEPGYPRRHFQERIEREGGLRGLESTWKCKDGSIIHVRESAHLVRDEKDLPLYYEGTVEDITELKQAEQQRAQYSEQLEKMVKERTAQLEEAQEKLVRQEKLAVLGQLAGGVGHELRNPLGVINSAIFYLKLVQPDADEKIKQYHAMIEQEVHTAEKIINDLLDFARLKGGEREPVSVSELVRRVLVRYPVPKSVTTTLKLPARLPKVFADPPQMEQVLGNLVINACQAMVSPGSTTGVPHGGKLTISARVVVPVPAYHPESRTGRGRQNELVAIAVKDTGVGIPPENMNKLFEPLFTTKLKGIGLGLAVSQKLVEANSGRIEVKSEPGKGSTFTVYLPVYQS
jgi:PAS domain S-box-containing protein